MNAGNKSQASAYAFISSLEDADRKMQHFSCLLRALLPGIPDALEISSSLLEECCPGCEWKELCLSIAGKSGLSQSGRMLLLD